MMIHTELRYDTIRWQNKSATSKNKWTVKICLKYQYEEATFGFISLVGNEMRTSITETRKWSMLLNYFAGNPPLVLLPFACLCLLPLRPASASCLCLLLLPLRTESETYAYMKRD